MMNERAARYAIQTGIDWRGDAVYYVYDRQLRLTVASYDNRPDAESLIRARAEEDA